MRRGEAGSRLDASYHHPALRQNLQKLEKSPFNVATLGTLLSSQNGIRYGTGTPPPIVEPSNKSVPFIRATDIKDGEIIVSGLLHISAEQEKSMKKCLVSGNELIIVRSGVNTGDCAVVPKSLAGSYAAYDLILQFSNEVVPAFVSEFLNTQSGRAQLNVLKGRAAQPHLNAEEVSSVKIPLPPLNIQQKLVSDLEAAREARKRKLAEADALLAGIDGFLLEQLGLRLPEDDKRLTFAVRLMEARTRCDADYQSPRFRRLRQNIENGIFLVASVSDICQRLEAGFAAGGDDQAFDNVSGIPHIRPLNITADGDLTFEGTKYVPRDKIKDGDLIKKGEVLFNNTNSTAWVGKTVVFDADIDCACSNHITRLTLQNEKANPYYIAALFNALRGLGLFGLLSTNFNNQAGINSKTLSDLRIPLPPIEIQQSIAAEVTHRREQARRLRGEAGAGWEEAKGRFERELLGE